MSDVIAVLTWWILVQIFGLISLPLTFRLFRRLPDRGYGVSKALGLILPSYLFWLLGMLGFLRNDSGSILLSLVAVAGASLFFYRRPASEYPIPNHLDSSSQVQVTQYPISLSTWLRANWKLILITELVFTASFFGWALYKAYVPRIMTSGGEKFMELAFLNGIRRSPTLPPLDPWLSGYAISYYYFGYLMMSILIRLSGVTPAVGFNIGGALLFALTATGAFSLLYNLVASERVGQWASGPVASAKARASSVVRRPAVAIALLGLVFVVFLSNYEGPLEVAHWNGLGSAGFWKWLDIQDLDHPPPTPEVRQAAPTRLVRPVTGPGWGWWWRASRVIFDYNLKDWPRRYDETAEPPPHRRENIDEFPFFSFLHGDMHPHILALPFILLTLTAALTLFQMAADEQPLSKGDLALYAVIFGAMGFLNAWDLPFLWAIAVGAYSLGRLTSRKIGPESQPTLNMTRLRPHLRPIAVLAAVLGPGGGLLYAPFYVSFQSQASGVLAHVHSPTRLAHFSVMFGPLLLILVAFLAWSVYRARKNGTLAVQTGLWTGATLLILALGVLFITAIVIRVSPSVRALVASGMADQDPGTVAARYLSMRLGTPWVTLLLTGMIAAAVALLGSRGCSRVVQYSLILTVGGAVLTLAPEYVYIKDVFGVRLNTIFKFYHLAWVLWAVAAAGAVYATLFAEDGAGPVTRRLFGGGLAVVIGLGLIYPLLAIPDRVREFPEAPTLDGTVYLADAEPADYAAVQWLNTHVRGTPVILEKPGGGYVYEGRVSAQTGLPTLLGWAGHEHQWRGNTIEQDERRRVFEELCQTTDAQRTLTLLHEYDITYVYVGPLERANCPESGLNKFERLMDLVYDRDGVRIFQRRGAPGSRAGDVVPSSP